MVGLLATDLSFTLKNKSMQQLTAQEDFNSWMNILWQVVYWCNFLFGTVLKTFFSKYWLSGHFGVGSKSKHAFKQLAIQIIIGVPVLLLLLGLGYYFLREQLQTLLSTILILLVNIQGMCILVLLLAYGLAFLPVKTWKRTNTEAIMYEHLLGA
jgi:fatty acid desaturase